MSSMTTELLGPLSAVRSVSGIDPHQAVQLEAIGFGLDAIDALYRRLVGNLAVPQDLPLIFADAWAMVDWMHRLDGLVAGCRGLPQAAEAVVEFRSTSSLAENLRHIFQHPQRALRETSDTRRSLWGHLGWQLAVNSETRAVGLITPFGRWDGGEFRRPSDAHLPARAQIDRVSLFSPDGEVEIGLTGQHEAAVRFARRLDAAVQVAERGAPSEILRLRIWPPTAP
jgi:hypothetical protein